MSDPYAVVDLVVGLIQCPGAGAAANCDGLLEACRGKGFANLRDEAIIRLHCNTGARLSEVGNLRVADLDLTSESVHYRGKGAKDRRVRVGPKTARAVSRYLRVRDRHLGAQLPWRVPVSAGPARGESVVCHYRQECERRRWLRGVGRRQRSWPA